MAFISIAIGCFACVNSGTGYSKLPADFLVQRTNMVIDNNGFLHLFGELKNTSTDPKQNITIFATFFDAAGKVVGNASGDTVVRDLMAGNTSPFELLFLNEKAAKEVHNFSLAFNSTNGPVKENALDISSARPRLDIFGIYYIYGTAFNSGNESTTNSLVISTFYDNNANIIYISKAMTEPVNITAGSSASFSIVMDKKDIGYKIKNFSLIIDSDQYVSSQKFGPI